VFPHLDHIFDEIETHLQGTTFIVGGYLNTARLAETVWPGYGHGPFFERIRTSMFFDCTSKFHDHELQTYFRKGGKPWQDDHLFVSHDLADHIMSCNVINNETLQTFSNHIPLVAELELPGNL
jgi:hypothetical protein